MNSRKAEIDASACAPEAGSVAAAKVACSADGRVAPYDVCPQYIHSHFSPFSTCMKRTFDIILSIILLIVFSPVFLFCYIAVKIGGGPAIYKQERIGKDGKPFFIYKFRSMRTDAEKEGPQLSSSLEEETRLTRVGKFIRGHHLDELPQFWNVLKGDMSFIGPRPERRFFIDQIMQEDPRYECLYQIRPGVTSYATLYNGYTDTMEKMIKRLQYDLYYLEHGSFGFDLKILFKTFLSVISGKKI